MDDSVISSISGVPTILSDSGSNTFRIGVVCESSSFATLNMFCRNHSKKGVSEMTPHLDLWGKTDHGDAPVKYKKRHFQELAGGKSDRKTST